MKNNFEKLNKNDDKTENQVAREKLQILIKSGRLRKECLPPFLYLNQNIKNPYVRIMEMIKESENKKEIIEKELAFKEFNLHYENPAILEKEIDKMNFFEKLKALEKGIREKKLTIGMLSEYLYATENDRTRLAIINSLQLFKKTESAEKCIEILANFALNTKFNDWRQKGYDQEKEFDEIHRYYSTDPENNHFLKYINNFEDDADDSNYDILKSAAIECLSSFGQIAKKPLIKIFFDLRKESKDVEKEHLEKYRTITPHKNRTNMEKNKNLLHDWRNNNKDVFRDDSISESNFQHNRLIIKKLEEIGGNDLTDFAIDFVINNKDSIYTYANEIKNLLKSSDKEYSKKKIIDSIGNLQNYQNFQLFYLAILLIDLIGIESFKAQISLPITKQQKVKIDFLYYLLAIAREKELENYFEIIKDLDIEIIESGEGLNEKEKREVLEISKNNYFNIVFKKEPQKAKIIVDRLKKELFEEDGAKNQRIYTLKYKGRIIAFCKFKPLSEKPDELELTSVNISSNLHGLKIGEYFISKVLETESKKHIINGDTFVKNTGANKLYFEKVGFENMGEYESEKYLGEKLYKMRMDKLEKQ